MSMIDPETDAAICVALIVLAIVCFRVGYRLLKQELQL